MKPRNPSSGLWLVGATLLSLTAGMSAQTPEAGWQASAQVLQGYSNNVLMVPGQSSPDATTSLVANVGRSWAGPLWNFSLDYMPETRTFARHSALNYLSQALHQEWRYSAGPHTSLTWTSDVARFPERAGAPQFAGAGLAGVAGASQATSLTAVLTRGATQFGISHAYSLHSRWSAGVGGNLQAYRADAGLATPAGTPPGGASRTRGLTFNLGWNHDWSATRTVSFALTNSEAWFPGLQQHLRNTSLQVSLEQKLGSSTTLHGGLGPAWNWNTAAAASGLPAALRGFSYAASAGMAEAVGQSQFGLDWNHSIQMGMQAGGQTTDTLALQVNRRWRRWSAGASLGNSRFASLERDVPATQTSLMCSGQVSYSASRWRIFADTSYYSQPLAFGGFLQPLRRVQADAGIAYTLSGAAH